MTKEEDAAKELVDTYATCIKEGVGSDLSKNEKGSFINGFHSGIKHRDENPKPIGPWVKMEELPPPKGVEVLSGWFTDIGFEKGLGTWDGGHLRNVYGHRLRATHWAPIPLEEPPKSD